MTTKITRKLLQSGVAGKIEITEYENNGDMWLEIKIFGSAGGERGRVVLPRKDFMEALEKFWPEEVAAQFKKEEDIFSA